MLFFLLTAMQAMGNTYYAYVNLQDFRAWSELFGLIEEEVIFQKRVLSIVSGAILPIVALGFIKSLVDYIKPDEEIAEEESAEKIEEKPDSLLVDGGGSLTRVNSQDSEDKAPEIVAENSEEENAQLNEIIESDELNNISEVEQIENSTEERIAHNGGEIVVTDQNQRRILHKIVETPSSAVDPTKL
jgi:ATP:corrinoid adenosyltransferase